MATLARRKGLQRKDRSTIIHFDYDCFYASVFEAENPALRSLPLAVQQKQIVVTCNYEARKRGLHKLQLIKDAKHMCPELVIVLGEDLTRFRNASKALYNFLRAFSWNGKVERLGFDEVFLDVTDIIDYNVDLLNTNDLRNSFFCLSKTDPTVGFAFDATAVAGNSYSIPPIPEDGISTERTDIIALQLRLQVGSHLAQHLRYQLEDQTGYTATVGVSTSKLLAKLVGNVHKPRNQTTLMPPYPSLDGETNSVTSFLDAHEVGKIPGIGFKSAQKIRDHVLGRSSHAADAREADGAPKENVTVRQVRTSPGMSPEALESILSGPGAPHGIGAKVWGLIHGMDDSEVGQAREIPKQISIEDSYVRLDTLDEVLKELAALASSLITRIRIDLLEDGDDVTRDDAAALKAIPIKKWVAFPKTLRLSTRRRISQAPDGSRIRNFNRISRSTLLPNFVFNLSENTERLADKLVTDALLPLFRRLHPEKSGWDLNLINVAVTNMIDAGGDGRGTTGRDISKMFKQQNEVLKDWKISDEDAIPSLVTSRVTNYPEAVTDDTPPAMYYSDGPIGEEEEWDSGSDVEDISGPLKRCDLCGVLIPEFASTAHQRFHEMDDGEDRNSTFY